MNKFILPLLLIFLAACSGKMEDPVSTKVTIAGLAVAGGQNGGILLAGTNLDESHTFIQDISENPSIVLEKGSWKFIGIAWDGANGKMTGVNRCAIVHQVEIQPPSASIALNFSAANCNSNGQERLVRELLGNAYQTGTNQFKVLKLNICEHVDTATTGCLSGGNLSNIQTGSFEVSLGTEMTINNQTQETGALRSQCFAVTDGAELKYANTAIQIPSASGLNELIHKPMIRLHDSTNCSDPDPIVYRFQKGFLEHEDQVSGGGLLLSDLDVNNGSSEIQLYLEHNPFTVNGNPIGSAHSLHWQEATPLNSGSITAEWTQSTDPNVVSESAQLFSTPDCSGAPIDVSSDISSANPTLNYIFSASDGDYSFKVLSKDISNNPVAQSACSTIMTVDMTAPSSATGLGYASTVLNWSPSVDGDVDKQEVSIYSDAACSTPAGSPVYFYDNITASTSASSFGAAAGIYYFDVKTYDEATNMTVSPCSASFPVP